MSDPIVASSLPVILPRHPDFLCDECYRNRIRDIQRIAAGIAANGTRQDRSDFIDDAPALVLVGLRNGKPAPISVYEPSRAALSTWIRAVLKNAWVDILRRKNPKTALSDYPIIDTPDERSTEWLDTPFTPQDLMELGDWDPILRVELLSLGGLWHKVPRECWEDWLLAYESIRETNLIRPLPPEDWDPGHPPGKRTQWLAEALGYRTKSLAVRWSRRKEDLRKLSFVRDLVS